MRKTISLTLLTIAWGARLFAADGDMPRSLYDRLGGMPAMRAVADDLVNRIFADTRVNQWFAAAAADSERAAAYKAKLADFICQATGGPCRYGGKDMVTAHQGRGVTAEAFQSVVEDLVATLDKLHVPEKEKQQVLALLGPLRPAIVQSQEH